MPPADGGRKRRCGSRIDSLRGSVAFGRKTQCRQDGKTARAVLEEVQMDYALRQRNPAKHVAGIGFVLVFHALLVYALVTGLARKVVEVIRQPLETKIIEEVNPPPP